MKAPHGDRVTYRVFPGCRWLVEDIEADHYRVRHTLHVLARVGWSSANRWTCALRVAITDAVVEHTRACAAPTPCITRYNEMNTMREAEGVWNACCVGGGVAWGGRGDTAGAWGGGPGR